MSLTLPVPNWVKEFLKMCMSFCPIHRINQGWVTVTKVTLTQLWSILKKVCYLTRFKLANINAIEDGYLFFVSFNRTTTDSFSKSNNFALTSVLIVLCQPVRRPQSRRPCWGNSSRHRWTSGSNLRSSIKIKVVNQFLPNTLSYLIFSVEGINNT